jgi:hypothetical protein
VSIFGRLFKSSAKKDEEARGVEHDPLSSPADDFNFASGPARPVDGYLFNAWVNIAVGILVTLNSGVTSYMITNWTDQE